MLTPNSAQAGEVDDTLCRLFGSSLLTDISSANQSIPAKTRQTAVNMILEYRLFFGRHGDYLPPMLNFLFDSLRAPALANVAARAILENCLLCKRVLVSELNTFLQQYEALLTWATTETYTKEKVIGGVAAIIQVIPKNEDKLAPLSTLIQFVEKDSNDCIRFGEASQAEESQSSGICALKCLASMGKSLQADDVVIDLDSDSPQHVFWAQGPGATLQAKIVYMLKMVTRLLNENSDAVEAGCQILRSGYKESTPGLFVFPHKVTVDLVLASNLNTARFDYVLDTAYLMLGRHAYKPDTTIKDAASTLLNKLVDIILSLGGKHRYDCTIHNDHR